MYSKLMSHSSCAGLVFSAYLTDYNTLVAIEMTKIGLNNPLLLQRTVLCLLMLFSSPIWTAKGIIGGLNERSCPCSHEFDYLCMGMAQVQYCSSYCIVTLYVPCNLLEKSMF